EVPGLPFINQLRPVTYHYNTKKFDEYIMKAMPDSIKAKRMQTEEAYQTSSANTYTGFIAQEVEASAKKIGYEFSGVDKPKNDGDTYSLRYAEFTVPLVKAVQELSTENESLKLKILQQEEKNTFQEKELKLLKIQMEELRNIVKNAK
ncbi:MAG: tail fiber domain-containing protein, partial [Bacteroidetes bacterium]|nr:tail fiber domain-containing protein [Bacteroidota bacterium]